MSASHRSLARLPLSVFEDLVKIEEGNQEIRNPVHLRQVICEKLQATKVVDDHFRSSGKTIKVKTVRDFFFLPTLVILQALDPLMTYDECLVLEQRIARHCSSDAPRSALELLESHRPTSGSGHEIPTGLASLDVIFSPFNGLPAGSVVEIVGSPGVGKSHFAYQLCLECVMRKRASAVFIDAEGKASLGRLQEMAYHRLIVNSTLGEAPDAAADSMAQRVQQALQHIQLESPQTVEALMQGTLVRIENDAYLRIDDGGDDGGDEMGLLGADDNQRRPIRLLVVDSIAAPFRRDHRTASHERTQALMQIAQSLKRVAHQLSLCVVVINQVGTAFTAAEDDGKTTGTNGQPDEDAEVRAALGTTWHHCVSTRLVLAHTEQHRTATVVKSNVIHTPSKPVSFTISAAGIDECHGRKIIADKTDFSTRA